MLASLAFKEKLKAVERGDYTWVEPLRRWILDTKQANVLSQSDDYSQIKRFVLKIGTNPTIHSRSARFSPPAPSQFIASQRHFLPAHSSATQCVADLSDADVSFCGG